MKKILTLSVIAAAAMASSTAMAADWSDTSVGYRYASHQSEPSVSDKVAKNILSFTHVSGDKLGTNFFTIDLLKSNGADPAAGNVGGAQEYYGFYKRSFSLSALSGSPVTMGGWVKDVNLNFRVDAGSKNTSFAPAPRKFRVGPSLDLPVSAGFWNVGLDAYRESNHNGLVNKDVTFDTTWALTSSWTIPAGPGAFRGFFDMVGPKGKDGFSTQTKTETLLQANYMFDVGGPKSAFKAGLGVEYWNNKFGNNQALDTKRGSKATSPLILVEYHL